MTKRNKCMNVITAVMLVAAFIAGIITAVICSDIEKKETVEKNLETAEEALGEERADDASESAGLSEEAPEKEDGPSEKTVMLKNRLEEKIKGCEGEWAVYVEDLNTGEQIVINNKKMVSASLIKLFIMANIYEEVESGRISKDEVSGLLHSMITVSDNEASNALVAKLGGGTYKDMYDEHFQKGLKSINSYLDKHGYKDSEQQRDMKSSRPNPIPEQNYTSVLDCGLFLSRLYKKELVSKESDEEMLELLKQQTRTSKIPAGLPSGTASANKTGELSDVENDVAIVFSPNADYVLCVMSNNVSSTGIARENITDISRIVYNSFND